MSTCEVAKKCNLVFSCDAWLPRKNVGGGRFSIKNEEENVYRRAVSASLNPSPAHG